MNLWTANCFFLSLFLFISMKIGSIKVSFFHQCSKMQIIPIKKFYIQTCFFQFLWICRLKCWFKGQVISRIHLSLPNAYTLMCFDRNINGNRDVKFWMGLMVIALMKETYFRYVKGTDKSIYMAVLWGVVHKLRWQVFGFSWPPKPGLPTSLRLNFLPYKSTGCPGANIYVSICSER